VSGADLNTIERKVEMKELLAPIKKGEEVGVAHYYLNGKEIGSVEIVAVEDIDEIRYLGTLQNVMEIFFNI
jgi:D-alanyl-D-alanine carboxypeptidase (penicillin-binding protein 5/6)